MRSVGLFLKEHLPEIMVEWSVIAADEPWVALPEGERIDGLPQVLESLITVALFDPLRTEAHEKLVHVAGLHGIQRRDTAQPGDVIFREYYLLRNAIWSVLSRESRDPDVYDAMIHLDAAINTALRASLFGFHLVELEGEETYEQRLRQLALHSQNLQA